jgi:dTDP-4-amino-4,6-dideoxygalactose transaminase
MGNLESSSKLALLGGEPLISEPFAPYRSIGEEELEAGKRVIESGVLSSFTASPGDSFYGGQEVKKFERAWEQYFHVKHAVAVNSWTSGLMAAVGAVGIEPGDEVIVPPWTMSATATAVINWNGIPVFADIDSRTFNIDPESVELNITPHTKAIIAADIFGQSADIDALKHIANKYALRLISDSAQAPGARYGEHFAGTLADVGGFSLNYHKHIHTGEGGVCVTNNDVFAQRLRLIRNHAEAVADEDIATNNPNMIGYNFRMGEVEAAIGYEQLKKLNTMISDRERIEPGVRWPRWFVASPY